MRIYLGILEKYMFACRTNIYYKTNNFQVNIRKRKAKLFCFISIFFFFKQWESKEYIMKYNWNYLFKFYFKGNYYYCYFISYELC